MTARPPVRGLVLGKFMPPHRGHLHLVAAARARADELTVLVCSLAREPIPGALRHAWMRELLAASPNVRVVHVTDENPSEPHEHPRFWEIWTETIRRACPDPPDVLFTSEDYGDELARRLGCRHVLVDRDRHAFPVSGTAARAAPLAHWELLPEPVRAHYALRVVVTGPESTGKTTLARRLAEHYRTTWVPEYAREYLDEKMRSTGAPLDATDIEPIARGQIAAEEAGARAANRVVFLDTDLVSTRVYAEHYYQMCPAWIVAAAAERRADLYLLCDVDVPWVPDPQRDRPHLRAEMHALFREAVERRGVPVVRISGSWDERFEQARAAVDELLARHGAPVSRPAPP